MRQSKIRSLLFFAAMVAILTLLSIDVRIFLYDLEAFAYFYDINQKLSSVHVYYGPPTPETVFDKTDREQVRELIENLALEYDVNASTALRIANCESGYKWDAKNPHSSATGIYQFITGTWENIGSPGDRLSPNDNIRAFMETFLDHPEWWECK